MGCRVRDAQRRSASALTPIDEALASLLACLPRLRDQEEIDLRHARGRVLAEDIVAPLSVPPFANSAMDGYALRAADTKDPLRSIPVSQRLVAGSVGCSLAAGTAARIFTGAPLPEGADAVAMQENCAERDGAVNVTRSVEVGENVRPAGADIEAGSTLFSEGRRLRPQDVGALASLGMTRVRVIRRPVVALLTTGDELQRPGFALGPGQIYDSNFSTLVSLLDALGAEVVDRGRVPDTLDATREALALAAEDADCVITTGGVSVGEEDHVRSAVEQLGRIDLWRLAVKPGKPFAFGTIRKSAAGEACQFFGLPGNPVSAFVTFSLIVRPCLLALQGVDAAGPASFPVRSGFSRGPGGPRQEYLRAVLERVEGELFAIPLANQSSGVAASLSRSEGLVVVPPQVSVDEGQTLEFIPFSELGAA